MKRIILTIASILAMTSCQNKQVNNTENTQTEAQPSNTENTMTLTQEWDKIFPQSDKVNHRKVTFKNRYGIIPLPPTSIPLKMLKANSPLLLFQVLLEQ